MISETDDYFNSEWIVELFHNKEKVYKAVIPFVKSFGYVDKGKPLLYIDSLGNIGLALNGVNFAETHEIQAGPGWQITIRPDE